MISNAALATSLTDNVDRSSYTVASWTPVANRVYLVWVRQVIGAGSVIQPTMSGNSMTWEHVRTASAGTAEGISCFIAYSGASPTTGTTTVDFGGTTHTGCIVHIIEVTGAFLGGATALGAIVQHRGWAQGGLSSPFSLDFVDPPLATSRCFAGFGFSTNASAMTPRANWTELGETGHGSPSSRLETQWRSDASEQTTSVSGWTGTVSIRAIIVELKPEADAEAASVVAAIQNAIANVAASAESVAEQGVAASPVPTILSPAGIPSILAASLDGTVTTQTSGTDANADTGIVGVTALDPSIVFAREASADLVVSTGSSLTPNADIAAHGGLVNIVVTAHDANVSISEAIDAEIALAAAGSMNPNALVVVTAELVSILANAFDASAPSFTNVIAELALSSGVAHLSSVAISPHAALATILVNANDATVNASTTTDVSAEVALSEVSAHNLSASIVVNAGSILVLATAINAAPSISGAVVAGLAPTLTGALSPTSRLATGSGLASVSATAGNPQSMFAIMPGTAVVSAAALQAFATTGLALAIIFKVLVNGRRFGVKSAGRPYGISVEGLPYRVTEKGLPYTVSAKGRPGSVT